MLREGRGCRCLSPSPRSFFPSLWLGGCGDTRRGCARLSPARRGPRVRVESGIPADVGIAAGKKSWKKGNGANRALGLGLGEVLGNEETVKMPEVGRWLFYPTFYRSKFPSLLCWFLFYYYYSPSLPFTHWWS